MHGIPCGEPVASAGERNLPTGRLHPRLAPLGLASELTWVLQQPRFDGDAAELILEEAFVGDEPRDALRAAAAGDAWTADESWSPPSYASEVRATTDKAGVLRRLRRDVDTFREGRRPAPYWQDRRSASAVTSAPQEAMDSQQRLGRLTAQWNDAVSRLATRGYLARAAPRPCVDDEDPPPDPGFTLDSELERRLGVPNLWPLRPQEWDEDTFYSLVEAVGDLVARPRHRQWHSYRRCGWHYDAFATAPAQALYRAEVNDLLQVAGTGLRLAVDGEDEGRLVHMTGDDRDQLLERVVATPDPVDRDTVHHAVALFRARGADREAKRSAVVALARILEHHRRPLLKTALLSKDEGALFRIANGFDVRHRDGKQYEDYAEEFLEWIFWRYLATIELTDRLTARTSAASAS